MKEASVRLHLDKKNPRLEVTVETIDEGETRDAQEK